MTNKTEAPPNARLILEGMLKNGLDDIAREKIKLWGLKYEIRGGNIIDASDTTEAWLSRFITLNPAMIKLKDHVKILAKESIPVLVSGPTGTGKEIIARALHGEKEGRFIAINCGGLPEHLIESELFGHVQGAFTGAVREKQGLFKQAGAGTIFLDEIAELPLHSQAKLLRALQEKTIRKVGGDKEEDINCRVVCATLRDLKSMVASKAFRLDLYARISAIELDTIGLEQRYEDIIPILNSMEKGEELVKAMDQSGIDHTNIDVSLNVRSLEQHVIRYRILKQLPSQIKL